MPVSMCQSFLHSFFPAGSGVWNLLVACVALLASMSFRISTGPAGDMNNDIRSRRPLLYLLAAYALAGAALFPFFRYNLTPDATAYIGLARNIARGDFAHAFNGHWSPLLSWLLAPLLATGLEPFIAFRLLMLVLGAYAILAGARLVRCFDLQPATAALALAVLAVMALSFALLLCTPDLLLAALLVHYLGIVLDPRRAERPWAGAAAGIVGGFAYLAKSYGLPFFAVHFTVVSAWRWFAARGARRRAVAYALAGYLAFAAIAAPWAAVLSARYGHFTTGTAARYNISLVSPTGRCIQPMANLGFLPPPDDTALSVWQDPSVMPVFDWNPFGSRADVLYLAGRVALNTLSFLRTATKWSVFALPVLVGYLVLAVLALARRPARHVPAQVLFTAALYTGGYLPLLIESRYLWLVSVLLLFMGAECLDALSRHRSRAVRAALAALLAASFLVAPVANVAADVNKGRDVAEAARALKARNVGGRIASHNNWLDSLYLCYHLDAKYYGFPAPGDTSEMIETELQRLGMEYYLFWDDNDPTPRFLARYPRMGNSPLDRLAVYELR